jgi:hypothetical protein
MSIRENKVAIPIKPRSTGKVLDVPFISQKKSNWCWAACAAMVLSFYKIEVRQCRLAAQGTGISTSNCCTDSTSDSCNKALYDDEITDLWHARNIPAIPEPNSISGKELLQEIDDHDRPVEMGYGPELGKRGIGHVVILYGWQQESNAVKFLTHNPQNRARKSIASFALTGSRLKGIWNATWKQLDKPNP